MHISITKRLAFAFAAAVVALAMPLAALASWSPDRPLYTYNGPGTPGADHVVFDSFVKTPQYGAEPQFFDGKDATITSDGGFQDIIQAQPGQTLKLRVYVHNNADPSLNASGAGIARNTKVRVWLPTASAQSLRSFAYISADNANPGTVSDTLDFQNPNTAVSLSYVPGSAHINTNALDTQLSDSIVTTGAPIGYDKLDGNVPGCFQYVAYVTLQVKVNGPSISLEKKITTPGSTTLFDTMKSNPGDEVVWVIHFKNTSGTQVDHLTVRDVMPAHETVVPGSVKLRNANHPDGLVLTDTGLFGNGGVDAGSYTAGSDGYISFHAKVNNDFATTDCNPTLVNQAFAHATGVNEIKAQATDTVNHTCVVTPTVTPPAPQPQIPATGAADILGGAMGTSALGYAVHYWRRSRKSLINALRK